MKGTCKYSTSAASKVTLGSYSAVTPSDRDQMYSALLTQPLAVSVDASGHAFQYYKKGILDNANCGTDLDHAVLVVGYGTDVDSGLDYWTIKNSWGWYWGDNGYIKLAVRDGDGTCGVQMQPFTIDLK